MDLGGDLIALHKSYRIKYFVCNIMGPWLFLSLVPAQEKVLLVLKLDNYGKEEEKAHNCAYLLGILRQLWL